MAGGDEFLQVAVELMMGKAGHRRGIFGILVAAGQGQPQQRGGGFGVVEEQFVKVAHPKQQKGIPARGFCLVVLLHHRRHDVDVRQPIGLAAVPAELLSPDANANPTDPQDAERRVAEARDPDAVSDTMKRLLNKLTYRLAGGIGAVLLGVLAAAQASRDGDPIAVPQPPPSLTPAPLPIVSQPIEEEVIDQFDSEFSPAGYDVSGPGDAAIAQVGHDEQNGGGFGFPAPSSRRPLSPAPATEALGKDADFAPPGFAAPESFSDAPADLGFAPPGFEPPAFVPPTFEPPPAYGDAPDYEMAGDDVGSPESDFNPPQGFAAPDYGPPPSFDPPSDLAAADHGPDHSADHAADHAADNPIDAYLQSANTGLAADSPPAALTPAPDYAPPPSGFAPSPTAFAPPPAMEPPPVQNFAQSLPANSLRGGGPMPELPAAATSPIAAAPNHQPPQYDPPQYDPPARTTPAAPASFAGPPRMAAPPMPQNFQSAEPLALAQPGDRRLDGVQSPSIVIQKRGPAEVQVNRPASFVLSVQNVGPVEAMGVEVHDRIPEGMELIDAVPAPQVDGDLMRWQLGALAAGDERTIQLNLVPRAEGELGSVARVTFEAAASIRTRSTRPQLSIEQLAPAEVMIGGIVELELQVANPGTGTASNVVLQTDVPEGFRHAAGRQLDNPIGSLAAGQSRREILRMRAVAPGTFDNTVRLIGDDGLTAEHTVAIRVIAPQLTLALDGPSRRFLRREATYNLQVQNTGSADATNLQINVQLDRGLEFVRTENGGVYDPNRHLVRYRLQKLPAGQTGSVPLTLLPIRIGSSAIGLEATADLQTTASANAVVAVEGQSELTFTVTDLADPVEIGAETTYEIRVKNTGSLDDTNVQVAMNLPAGLQIVASETGGSQDERGGIIFDPLAKLAAGEEIVHRVQVRGVQADTHVVQAVVVSDRNGRPVTKEESTLVYADR